MKIGLVLMLLAFGPAPAIAVDQTELLKQIFSVSIRRSGLNEDKLAKQLTSWSGISKAEGVEALFDVWDQASTGREIRACRITEKLLQLPRQQVCEILTARIRNSEGNLDKAEKAIMHLESYADMPSGMQELVSLLDDKRSTIRNNNPEFIGDVPRICDAAKIVLSRILEKRGLIKFGEPGDSASALFTAQRDAEIKAIKIVLAKNGIGNGESGAGAKNDIDRMEATQTKLIGTSQPSVVVADQSTEVASKPLRGAIVWVLGLISMIVLWLVVWIAVKVRKQKR
jgi:hypothetical protein